MLPEKDFDRRDFIWTALGASAALALASSASARSVTTDAERTRRRRRLDSDGDRRPARLSRDAGQGRAVSRGARRRRDVRAQPLHQGCLPAARQGRLLRDRARPLHAQSRSHEDHGHGRDHADREHASTTPSSISDYDATVEFARTSGKADIARMAITGFCRGGRTTLVYATANPEAQGRGRMVRRASAGTTNEFTPRTAMDRVADLKVPLLGLYGAQGRRHPGRPGREVLCGAEGRRARPPSLSSIPEAGHGFHADFRPDNYRKADAEDGWKRMLAWFKKYGVA